MPSDEPSPRSSDEPAPTSASEPSLSVRHAREQEARAAELNRAVGRIVAERYRLLALIGTGGMGAVYEAERLADGEHVAVKLVDAEWLRESVVQSRFAREARAASAVESAHIVRVFDAGSDGDLPYLAMELLRGEDLGKRLRRRGKIERDECLEIFAQTLQGLADAHEAGIVHRDLKPDNVFLVTDEDKISLVLGPPNPPGGSRTKRPDVLVKLVDFGVSKIERLGSGTAPLALTQKGMVLGTPLYMAPEQAQACQDVDARADIYSAGAILFECLVGRPPHVGETYEQIIVSICMNDAPDIRKFDPSLPEGLARFLARALHRDRAKRFSSVRQMLVALSELRASLREAAKKSPAPVAATMMSPGASGRGPASGPTSRRTPSSKREASADGAWSSASPSGRGGSPDSSPALPSTRRLVTVGLVATFAGALVTVALVTALRSPREVAASPLPSGAVSSLPSAAAPIASLVALPETSLPVDVDASRAASAPRPARAGRASKTGPAAPKGGDLELQRDFP